MATIEPTHTPSLHRATCQLMQACARNSKVQMEIITVEETVLRQFPRKINEITTVGPAYRQSNVSLFLSQDSQTPTWYGLIREDQDVLSVQLSHSRKSPTKTTNATNTTNIDDTILDITVSIENAESARDDNIIAAVVKETMSEALSVYPECTIHSVYNPDYIDGVMPVYGNSPYFSSPDHKASKKKTKGSSRRLTKLLNKLF